MFESPKWKFQRAKFKDQSLNRRWRWYGGFRVEIGEYRVESIDFLIKPFFDYRLPTTDYRLVTCLTDFI